MKEIARLLTPARTSIPYLSPYHHLQSNEYLYSVMIYRIFAYGSSDAQAQILLTALHDLIIPLIRDVTPNICEPKELSEGPEAEHLLIALKNYVARIINGHSEVKKEDQEWGTRAVCLKDLKVPKTPNNHMNAMDGEDGKGQKNCCLLPMGTYRFTRIEDSPGHEYFSQGCISEMEITVPDGEANVP
ncbi:hypothetical protein BDN70DRAFT_900480 [Pholiota conissans]|uniref:Uncharacterized protein n=1 Tax=Pholiota conissans TaxID=109636 RepID=A0A9P5YMJ7_9AGAR|nr:hypothetical protein BDN70DRAFT_900480 [Pholiota conissans]